MTSMEGAKAVQLISVNEETGEFQIVPESMNIIASCECPVSVVMIAGVARSGKSFLLSQLAGSPGAFKTGHKTQACTKGIWMLNKPVKVTTKAGNPCMAYLMDCEGLGAYDKDSEHDTRLFAMSALLCSVLVFNSHGTLDENSLSQLGLIANLTKHIRTSSDANASEDSEQDLSTIAPSFCWVLRDFMLNLTDQYGDEQSPNDYMEAALKPSVGYDTNTLSKNRIRHAITSFFQQRECHTLVRPLDDEDQLQHIDQIPMEDLRPQFVDQLAFFKRSLLGNLANVPKRVLGQVVNGPLWAGLVHSYVGAVNNGGVPCVADAWSAAAEAECRAAVGDAVQRYTAVMDQATQGDSAKGGVRVLEVEEFEDKADEAWRSALDVFNARAVASAASSTKSRSELFSKLHSCRRVARTSNHKASSDQCTQLLHRLSHTHLSKSRLMGSFASAAADGGGSAAATAGDVALLDSPSETASAAIAGWEAVKGDFFREAPGPAKNQVWGSWTYTTFEQCMATLALQVDRLLGPVFVFKWGDTYCYLRSYHVFVSNGSPSLDWHACHPHSIRILLVRPCLIGTPHAKCAFTRAWCAGGENSG